MALLEKEAVRSSVNRTLRALECSLAFGSVDLVD
jgi:hypothetical protein